MDKVEAETLIDYVYWVNETLLETAVKRGTAGAGSKATAPA